MEDYDNSMDWGYDTPLPTKKKKRASLYWQDSLNDALGGASEVAQMGGSPGQVAMGGAARLGLGLAKDALMKKYAGKTAAKFLIGLI